MKFWPFFTRVRRPALPGPIYATRSLLIGLRQQAMKEHGKRSHLEAGIKALTTECLRSELGRKA